MGVLRLFIVVLLLACSATASADELMPSAAPPAPAPALTAAPGPVLLPAQAADPAPAEPRSVFTRWWFWTAAGVLVVGAIVLGVALQPRDPSCPAGTVCL